MRTALFIALWWLALTGWWLVVAGTNAGLELVAAVCAGLLGALLALALRGFEAPWLAKALKVPWKIVHELGVVFWALALHMVGLRRLSSRYRAFDFPAGERDGRRARRP